MNRGEKIYAAENGIIVPEEPIIPFVEGDGTGPEIWDAGRRVFDAAVLKAYGSSRIIVWKEVLAGEKAYNKTGDWLPKQTIEDFQTHLVGIKGPLTTPVGQGIRSLNVALRQILDLYVCLRPVRYYPGIPSPVRNPEKVDMVIFRENTEDVYAGYETPAGEEKTEKLSRFLREEMGWELGPETGIGIKPVSRKRSERLVRAAVRYALEFGRKSITLVHKGNIMKYTEGAFMRWGYALAEREFPGQTYPWGGEGSGIIIQDAIADAFLQQVLIRPADFDVIATTNLNGDYISDALAAQVGGIGIAPGANINYETGAAIFEATHGTAPKHAGQNKVNPSSLILSGKMMLDYLGWNEAARLIESGIERTISAGRVTYDLARLMDTAETLTTSGFADAIIDNM